MIFEIINLLFINKISLEKKLILLIFVFFLHKNQDIIFLKMSTQREYLRLKLLQKKKAKQQQAKKLDESIIKDRKQEGDTVKVNQSIDVVSKQQKNVQAKQLYSFANRDTDKGVSKQKEQQDGKVKNKKNSHDQHQDVQENIAQEICQQEKAKAQDIQHHEESQQKLNHPQNSKEIGEINDQGANKQRMFGSPQREIFPQPTISVEQPPALQPDPEVKSIKIMLRDIDAVKKIYENLSFSIKGLEYIQKRIKFDRRYRKKIQENLPLLRDLGI